MERALKADKGGKSIIGKIWKSAGTVAANVDKQERESRAKATKAQKKERGIAPAREEAVTFESVKKNSKSWHKSIGEKAPKASQ